MTDLPLWDWNAAWQVLPDLLKAFFTVTLVVTVVGTLMAAVLGLIIAMIRRSAPKPIAMIVGFFVNFVRMTPIIVQLMFAYFIFTSIPPLTIGIVIFGIHYSTYMAEVYRAGIEDVPPGQWEAATALSLSRTRTWVGVIIPQALRSTIPALGNYAISMFKDTPFLVVISVMEMVNVGLVFGGNHFTYIEAFTISGIIFLLASYPTALLVGRLEKRLAFTH